MSGSARGLQNLLVPNAIRPANKTELRGGVMSEQERTVVQGADEERHVAEDEQFWGESYYLDFVADDGSLGGYVRIGYYPNLGVEWWTTAIVEPGKPTVLSVSYHAPMTPLPAMQAQGERYSATFEAKQPLETFAVRVEAEAEEFADQAAPYRGESGTPVHLGIDLTWSSDGEPYHYEVATRYEIPCLVSGQITLGDRVVEFQGQGQRDHSWGVRDWWIYGWCWSSARFDDGTRIHATDVRIPGVDVAFGYIQTPDGGFHVVDSARVTEDLGAEGFPSRCRAVLNNGDLDVTIEPLAFGPLLLTSPTGQLSRFPRAMARFTDQTGRTGLGWVEWNQPQDL